MRHRAVNAGQRITHDGVVFNIESVLPDARRAFVDCVCEVINAYV
jgi:head-tail adaptor